LDRIRTTGLETEGSERWWFLVAVFGDPGTWGAAGGDQEVEVSPVADRAESNFSLDGGITKRDQNGLEELNSILGDDVSTTEVGY
jgi:hypothetical protein